MATPAFVQVTEGAGKRLASATYTENAQVVYDQKFVLGEPYLASYSFSVAGISIATGNSHLLEIMAGGSLNVRILHVRIRQNAANTTGVIPFVIVRLSTAGTGGGAVTASRYDTSDAASGATGMTLPTAKGTEGAQLWAESAPLKDGLGGSLAPIDWVPQPRSKPWIIPAGAANGIAIKNVGASGGGGTFDIDVECVETSF